MMTRRSMLAGGCSCIGLALAGCVTTNPGAVTPGFRPSAATDEGGLWYVLDQYESELKKSRHLIRDTEINAYVDEIACRLAGDHCPNIRVYVTRSPVFNASMAPNGMMQIYSGLLLRARNEAQLAAIIGHEIGHYVHRHTLANHRNTIQSASFATFLTLGLAVAGAPQGTAGLVELLTVAGIFAFNRDQEREADDVGVKLMAKAGYNPHEAAQIWEQLIAEQAAIPDKAGGSLLFATHPAPEERARTLRQRASALAAPQQQDGMQRYRASLRNLWRLMLDDELKRRQFGASLILFNQLIRDIPEDGYLHFAYGELYRLRDDEGDVSRARDAYLRSVGTVDPPPEAWRGLGFVLNKSGETGRADEAFSHYLQLAPSAPDHLLIKSYISSGG